MNLKKFKHYLKLNVDSKNTRTNYYSRVKCFFDKYNNFNQKNLNKFLESLIDNNISKSTFNNYLFAFKKYCEFKNIILDFPKQKTPNKSFRIYITEQEMYNELFPYFAKIFEKPNFNKFIFKMLFYTGIRPTELENLKPNDFDFENNIILIRNPKDKEDRKIPFPNRLKNEIKKYLDECGFDIHYYNMKYICDRINTELNYKKKLSIYTLRHSFAEFCLEKGLPIEHLQILMGHSDIQTTMIYARPKPEQAIKSYFNNIKIYEDNK
ncbi:MAG: tyrosine-type recombinase/integrase [Candidatus Helarchaeota archaeon]